jgi:hypothetical protein
MRGQSGSSDDAKAQVVASRLLVSLISKQLAGYRIHGETDRNEVIGARRFRRPVHRKAAGCIPSAGAELAAVFDLQAGSLQRENGLTESVRADGLVRWPEREALSAVNVNCAACEGR